MNVINPFAQREGEGSMGGLPTFSHGQIGTLGVIPFSRGDVVKTTSAVARNRAVPLMIAPPAGAGYLGTVASANTGSASGAVKLSPPMTHLPSPLRRGTEAAAHASSTAISRLSGHFLGIPDAAGRIVQAPPHPIVARPVAWIESQLGLMRTSILTTGKAALNAGRQSVPKG